MLIMPKYPENQRGVWEILHGDLMPMEISQWLYFPERETETQTAEVNESGLDGQKSCQFSAGTRISSRVVTAKATHTVTWLWV